ncbi:MAG: SDR family oxidoreductase [Planctomycetota bacterium]
MDTHSHPLFGKTALVTGGAKRLGRATALALAAEGADIVLHYRSSRNEAEEATQAIRNMGRKAWTIQADLSRPEEATGLFQQARQTAGSIHILINNAAIFEPSLLADFTVEDLARNVQINTMAPLQVSRAFVAQGQEGVIINFLDNRIVEYDKKNVAYHLSKRMLHSLTRMMAMEFAPKVRVNAVAPGLVLPPRGEDDAYVKRLVTTMPLQRAIEVRAVTDAVLFLVKNEFITGQVIFVDGGRHMKSSFYG